MTVALCAVVGIAVAGVVRGATTTQPSNANDDVPQVMIGQFTIRYLRNHPGLPDTRDVLAHATFMLRRVPGGFTGYEEKKPFEIHHFGDRALLNARYSKNAIKYIQDGIAQYLESKGLIAIFVYAANSHAPELPQGPDALLLSDYDRLVNNKTPADVQMVIVIGIAKTIRAITSTDRAVLPLLPQSSSKAEARIISDSPVHPGGTMSADPIQDYLSLLNRRSGRHVDISLSSADSINEDDVELDYLIHIAKPWTVYAGGFNSGTSQTNEWQERFGFIDSELTGNDDTLAVDFTTSSFADNYAFTSSYDFPIFSMQRVRGRVYGSFGKFNSSDLGLDGEVLNGSSSEAGAEADVNVFQHHQFFLDLFGGARVDMYGVDVKVPPTSGNPSSAFASYLFPYIGTRVSRETDNALTEGQFLVLFDTHTPDSPNKTTANELGRLDVDKDYMILQANASQSFYIEPLFASWDNRDKQSRPVAANEMYVSAQGQYTTGDKRLIPELEATAGGLTSVRGYPESVVAGDSVIFGTVEYRLHIPRLLNVAAPNILLGHQIPSPPLMGGGGGFNYQPRAANSPGDWDLIWRTFSDAGYVHYNKIKLEQAGTSNAGLVGVGTGLELRLRDNVSIRADYGWPLRAVHEAVGTANQLDILPGQGRFNFVFTLLY